jgi:hypothetical protein
MYDSRIARRWEMDPVFSQKHSPYSTFGNNPIIFVDIRGLKPGWYENEEGTMEYDPNINSQKDLDDKNIKGTYKGKEGVGVPKGMEEVKYLNEDGGVSDANFKLPEFTVSENKKVKCTSCELRDGMTEIYNLNFIKDGIESIGNLMEDLNRAINQGPPGAEYLQKIENKIRGNSDLEFEGYNDGANTGEYKTWRQGLAMVGIIVTFGAGVEIYLGFRTLSRIGGIDMTLSTVYNIEAVTMNSEGEGIFLISIDTPEGKKIFSAIGVLVSVNSVTTGAMKTTADGFDFITTAGTSVSSVQLVDGVIQISK